MGCSPEIIFYDHRELPSLPSYASYCSSLWEQARIPPPAHTHPLTEATPQVHLQEGEAAAMEKRRELVEEEEEEEVNVGPALVRKSRKEWAGNGNEMDAHGNGDHDSIHLDQEQGDRSNIKVTAVDEFLHKNVKNEEADSTSTDDSHPTFDIHHQSESAIKTQICYPVVPESAHPVGQSESNVGVRELSQNIVENVKVDSTSFSKSTSLFNSDNLHHESPKTASQSGFTVAFESWHASGTSESNMSVRGHRGHGQDTTSKVKEVPEELDVERVLEEQDTYDLYCPNCNSCITKRVILRKRKRISQEFNESKLAKAQPVQTDLVATSNAVETSESQDTEQDVFRCLSCFTFFIPTEGGFKLFNLFGNKSDSKNPQSVQQVQEKKSWMSFLNWKRDENKSGVSILNVQNTKNGEMASQTILPAEQPEGLEHQFNGVQQDMEQDYRKQNFPSMVSQPDINQKSTFSPDNLEEDRTIKDAPKRDLNLFNPFLFLKKTSHHETKSKKKEPITGKGDMAVGIADTGGNIVEIPFSNNEGKDITSIPEDKIKPVQEVLPANVVLPISSPGNLAMNPEQSPQLEILINVGDQTQPKAQGRQDWNVLKAIVYGGLIEAITSLCAVSSAAGADNSTSNIVTLGLAILLGGLLVHFNNLMELHTEEYETLDQDGRTTHYRKVLGRRGHFGLHATVAFLSFIVVGSLPPVIYGFSFPKSNNKEYKLIAVVSASLFCIALLAAAKAHVQSSPKPYIRSLLYYLGLGVSCSGVSFAAGFLIQKLLGSLGIFDNNNVGISSPPVEFLQLNAAIPAWRSY